MKKLSTVVFKILVTGSLLALCCTPGCKKIKSAIKYAQGTFPDTSKSIAGLNSQYDDYNSTLYILSNSISIIFSSNRGSSGGQFDLVQGSLRYQFDQTSGAFDMSGEMINDPFFTVLLKKANTSGNDLGPYYLISSTEGYEYLLVASQNAGGPLDLYYLKFLPFFGNSIPDISGPFPVKLLNSASEDAYISFDSNQDSAYFTSDRNGNFDIFVHKRTAGMAMDNWFNQDFAASTRVDSVNSSYDDKCPFIYKNIMIFTSNRPGGLGGYDLYYSLFKNGKWNSPVNFGPKINSSSDEFRPLVGYDSGFTNYYMIFSSNRPGPGAKGGFDLYSTGYTFPK
jgi:hypothetical protein